MKSILSRANNNRVPIFIIILIVFVLGFYVFSNQKRNNTKSLDQAKKINADKYLKVDFEGKGNPALLDIQQLEKGFRVFTKTGEEIYFNDAFPRVTSSYKIVKLNKNNKKEYLQWDNIVGPHETQTFFYTLIKGRLQPLPAFDFETNIYTLAFYTSRNDLGVGDFTSDGLSEVVENVDELPTDAPRLNNPDIEEKIRETFSKEGLSEKEMQDWIKIADRENYGKGRGGVVIWSIHSFVESEFPFFRKLSVNDYNEIADRYVSAMNQVFEKTKVNSKLMKVNNLSKDSIDFNYFVRDFWTKGNNYELPIKK